MYLYMHVSCIYMIYIYIYSMYVSSYFCSGLGAYFVQAASFPGAVGLWCLGMCAIIVDLLWSVGLELGVLH